MSKEIERKYLLPHSYNSFFESNTPSLHIRQSDIATDTEVLGLLTQVEKKVHSSLEKFDFSDEERDMYAEALKVISEKILAHFSKSEEFIGYRIRVRLTDRNDAELTVKWKTKNDTDGTIEREELNIPIPMDYGKFLLTHVAKVWITKMRYEQKHENGITYHFDFLLGPNRGINFLDVEFKKDDRVIPSYIEEVIHQEEPHIVPEFLQWYIKLLAGQDANPYKNEFLQAHPYMDWSIEERKNHVRFLTGGKTDLIASLEDGAKNPGR